MKNRKIISIIPNVLTSIALLLGLLSIFNLVSENLYNSIWLSCVFIYSAAFIDFIDGKIKPPTKPGLGIELNRDAIKKYQVA